MADQFPSLPEPPTMADVFRAFPHTFRPLVEYHDRLLRDDSPLTVAQRELIAAYVSGVNSCAFCYGAHSAVARAFGVEEEVFQNLVADVDHSTVEDKMKPLLKYVGKLTRTPSQMTAADAKAVYDAGWSEQALFDAISVCALFNFMNRIVEGTGLKPMALVPPADQGGSPRPASGLGGGSSDAHQAPHQYTPLIEMWGIADKT